MLQETFGNDFYSQEWPSESTAVGTRYQQNKGQFLSNGEKKKVRISSK